MVCLSNKLIWLPHISFDCFVIERSNCEEHSNYNCRKVHHSIWNRTSYHTRTSYEYRLVTTKSNIRFKLCEFAGSFDQLKVLTHFSHFYVYPISRVCLLGKTQRQAYILYRHIYYIGLLYFTSSLSLNDISI